ncbi:MAG: HEAT repeat domain-containing protein [Methanoregulaceae archaeon]|jgi:HEAT repeat protein|nr:HEAT repeat domain-containing protein [Methanoregulaceae archaeon]
MSGKTGVKRIIHGVWREIRNRVRSYSNVEDLRNEKDIPGLIKALGHRDLEVLYMAVEALGELKDPSAIPPLIKILSEDQYSAVRWKAAEALAKIGNTSVEPLIVLLGHPDEDVRWKAAIALGEIGEVRAIDPLIGLLRDEDRYVKGRVAVALGMIGQPAVSPLITALSTGDGSLRWGAAIALGRIRDPRAVAPLVQALGDKYENVRSEALASLKAMENGNIDLFIQLLNEVGNEALRDYIANAPVGEGPDSPGFTDFLQSIDPDIRERLRKALTSIDNPDLGPLINDLSGN